MKGAPIAVTGLGVVSSIGMGWESFWDGLLAGRSGISRIGYIDTEGCRTHYGGEVRDFDALRLIPAGAAKHLGRGSQFALAATKMAIEDANLSDVEQLRAGICLGTTMAGIQALEKIDEEWLRFGDRRIPVALVSRYPSCTMSANVARYIGLNGPNVMIPTACAAGNYAISYAVDLLRLNRVDVVVAGGADPFSRIAFTGFDRIFALAPERCQPFDKNRRGTLIGEAAGVLILERLEDARGRGAHIYAEVLGYGLSCDARHMTIPDQGGVGRVIKAALEDADMGPDDVDYISAHGTGTPANDRTECAAIRVVFGRSADHIPMSSIKSMLGHTMGAASALEAIACTLAVHFDKIPPTINYETLDPDCSIDCVPGSARSQTVKRALNNSFAFGGNNACVVFGKHGNVSGN